MARSTVHYADSETNNILKRLHNKMRPAGTPVQRVEYIVELLLLRIFEVKIQQDPEFAQFRTVFQAENDKLLFSELTTLANDQILAALNQRFFPFYAHIISEARKVWTGNLSTKVQDQLILIEEVFANSNFSNNVTSGNMAEIIDLVAELDKDRLLKTDLLGDAIESALSETGGTKDIGLHRTPDHIRQFMVALIAPTFSDQIFDPTVGTGGFMFDSFEFVMQGVSQDGHWPGPKAHSEMASWFKHWFSDHRVPMPSIELATDFYRNGVGGIEYLGMVRKMAAINFYVRGLNPGNIQQGDSLEKFGTDIMPRSKTVVLSNPPFGAERDKESYPNVWSEYPNESETTILFVKLMLETLKEGGRCAVVVSEGFLTWDQNSARALRRALLDECDLKAVISLPQGVFVSKGGQGPKTSILYFEKGRSTHQVWFYKVTNDGYTMGTNRKPQLGCQLVEALDMFHGYVLGGKEPPESRQSFCIPAEWIKNLDPRTKDKIREETRAEMSARASDEKAKLVEKLNLQAEAKKITDIELKDRLVQHEELWKSKTENAIAQKIERAHLYSLNLPAYRSALTLEQLAAWIDFSATYAREGSPPTSLEQKYRAISNASATNDIEELISTLDPRHLLELDIARQFLPRITTEPLMADSRLRTLQEIIASQQRVPRIKLRDLLDQKTERHSVQDENTYRLVTVKLKGRGVGLRSLTPGSEIKTDKWFFVRDGQLIMSRIDARNGAFGIIPIELDGAIVTSFFPVFQIKQTDVNPQYLLAMLTNERFYSQIENVVSGATGRRTITESDFLEMEVPLVAGDEQDKIVIELQRLSDFSAAGEQLRSSWRFILDDFPKRRISEIGKLIGGYAFPSSVLQDTKTDGAVPVIKIGSVLNGMINNDISFVSQEWSETANSARLQTGDVLVAMTRPIIKGGLKYAVVPPEFDGALLNQRVGRFDLNQAEVFPPFFELLLHTDSYLAQLVAFCADEANQPNVSPEEFESILVSLPPLDTQRLLYAQFAEEKAALNSVDKLRIRREERSQQIIERIWES